MTSEEVENYSSSSSESEEAPELALDQHGRIAGAHGQINYDFQCYQNILESQHCWSEANLSALIEDCKVCFTAREVNENEDYSDGETFFVPASSKPTTNIETLVLEIFRYHTKNMNYNPELSGAEWWSLVVDAEDGGVGFHWDKDYGMEEHGVSIFPHLGTVTYLGEVEAAPTLILQKVAPPMFHEDVSGPCGAKALLSWPEHGKHIVFDGRFLHAAVPELSQLNSGESRRTVGKKKRVSLLVNIWLNHLPRDAHPIAEKIRKKLSPALSLQASTALEEPLPLINMSGAADLSECTINVDSEEKKDVKTWKFTHSEYQYSIMVPIPVQELGEKDSKSDSRKKSGHITTLQFEYNSPTNRPNVARLQSIG